MLLRHVPRTDVRALKEEHLACIRVRKCFAEVAVLDERVSKPGLVESRWRGHAQRPNGGREHQRMEQERGGGAGWGK